jgi:hypothetical protein
MNSYQCARVIRSIGLQMFAIFLAGVACVLANAERASTQTCTREDAIKAETEASSLRTWRDVYDSYKRYHQCDDGAISEGYSNSVATLLADNWDHIEELNALARKDSKFKAFVLRHVDELMTLSQSNAIKENVRSRCPAKSQHLCRSINGRL